MLWVFSQKQLGGAAKVMKLAPTELVVFPDPPIGPGAFPIAPGLLIRYAGALHLPAPTGLCRDQNAQSDRGDLAPLEPLWGASTGSDPSDFGGLTLLGSPFNAWLWRGLRALALDYGGDGAATGQSARQRDNRHRRRLLRCLFQASRSGSANLEEPHAYR